MSRVGKAMYIFIYYWYHDVNKIFTFHKACIYGSIFLIKTRLFPITIWQLNKHGCLSLSSQGKCPPPWPSWLVLRWTPYCLLISFSRWDPRARCSVLAVSAECWLQGCCGTAPEWEAGAKIGSIHFSSLQQFCYGFSYPPTHMCWNYCIHILLKP